MHNSSYCHAYRALSRLSRVRCQTIAPLSSTSSCEKCRCASPAVAPDTLRTEKKDNKRRVCCLIFAERIQSLRLSISSQLAFDRIEQARETANFAARTFCRNDALGSGFVQFRHRVLQRLGKTFGIACHGFAEIANGMFNFGTTSTIALGARGGLTNAFHG